MKISEIITEFADYGENFAADMERSRMRDEMNADFKRDRTPVSEFDFDVIKRIMMPAARNKPDVKRQVDAALDDWEELFDTDAYIEDDVFNKVFSQYEKLKDSEESPLIKFNKMHALTKEIK